VASAGYEEQERRVREYHRRIQQCDPAGDVVNDTVTTLNFLYCHEDPKVAGERGRAFQGAFGLANAHLLFTREAYATTAYELLGNLVPTPRKAEAGSPAAEHNLPEGTAIGDPGFVIDQIKGWESIGVDGINFLTNGLEALPQDQVLESMRLFAREVMPAFREAR
jgi:hypothetical protein